MSKLVSKLDSAIEQSHFEIQSGQKISARNFQSLFQDPKHERNQLNRLFELANLNIPDEAINIVNVELPEIFAPYIDYKEKSVGIGLSHIVGGIYPMPLSILSRRLISASIKLGTEKVQRHIEIWKDKNEIQFNILATITSVTSKEIVSIDDGIQIIPSNQFSEEQIRIFGMPTLPTGRHDILSENWSCLSLKSRGGPALFQPNSNYKKNIVTLENKIPNITVESYCQALSIVCKGYIRPINEWIEVGELEAFHNEVGLSTPIGTSRTFVQEIKIKESDLIEACSIHKKINKMSSIFNKLAIERWIDASREESNQIDRFVSLRTALESLYLPGEQSGEKGFKLATRCAWHLGDSSPKRTEIFNETRKFYNVSSTLVHGGKLKKKDNADELFSKALEHCHGGIMKMLSKGKVPKWEEIIFGSLIEPATQPKTPPIINSDS